MADIFLQQNLLLAGEFGLFYERGSVTVEAQLRREGDREGRVREGDREGRVRERDEEGRVRERDREGRVRERDREGKVRERDREWRVRERNEEKDSEGLLTCPPSSGSVTRATD